jgi:hypothetical protein
MATTRWRAATATTACSADGAPTTCAAAAAPTSPTTGDTIVEANTTDATAGAELRIVLDPLVSLQAGDFVL